MEDIPYKVIRSARRTMAIQILPDGQVLLRCPYGITDGQIRQFADSKADWIRKHLPDSAQRPAAFSAQQLRELTTQASQVIPQRVAVLAPLVGVTYGRVTIRHQHTRWGSCSTKGNLNFNCLLMLAPPQVLDYVVVHELCHRKEMNHSPRFWAEVERVFPEYKACRKWLRENGQALIARL